MLLKNSESIINTSYNSKRTIKYLILNLKVSVTLTICQINATLLHIFKL